MRNSVPALCAVPARPLLARWTPRRRASLFALTATLCLAACATESPGPAPAAVVAPSPRTRQDFLTEADWQKELTASPDLKVLADAAGAPRRAAGVIEDESGRRLIWAEYAAAATTPREQVAAIFLSCKAPVAKAAAVCTAGKASYTATGATLTDAAGKPMETVAIGDPVMARTIVNRDRKTPTIVLAALNRGYHVDPVEAAAQADVSGFGKRRLVVVSAYGPAVGVNVQPIVAAAQKSALFDTVTVMDFARRADLQAIVPTMTPHDVLVWVGAGVLETKSGVTTTVGLTLSRGVLGDEMIHLNDPLALGEKRLIGGLLDAPALGGPGLLVFAGSRTVNPTGGSAALATAWQDHPVRPVVGFSGKITAKEAIAATAALLDQLGAGKTLDVAVQAGGHGMAATGTPAMLKAWKQARAASGFWAGTPGGKVPVSALLSVPIKIDPVCVQSASPCDYKQFSAEKDAGNKVESTQLHAGTAVFDCAPTFNGPWFACSGKNDATGQLFELKGLLLGTTLGEHALIYINGSASHAVQDIVVVGNATIGKVDAGGGSTTLYIGGQSALSPAAASTYVDAEGHCCVASSPLIQDNAQAGKLVLKF